MATQTADKVAVLVAVGLAQVALGDHDGLVITAKELSMIEPYQAVQIYLAAAESLSTSRTRR